MHTAQLGIASVLRTQGLPLPGHHLKLMRQRVVRPRWRCRQHSTIPQCEKDNLEPLQFLLGELKRKCGCWGTSLKQPLRQAGDVLSGVGGTRHLSVWSGVGPRCSIGVAQSVNPDEIHHLHT